MGSCHRRVACSLGALASAWLPGRGRRARPPKTARTSPRGPTFPLRAEGEGSRQPCPAGATPPTVAFTFPSDPLPLTEPPASCARLRGNVPGRPQFPLTPGPSHPEAGEGTPAWPAPSGPSWHRGEARACIDAATVGQDPRVQPVRKLLAAWAFLARFSSRLPSGTGTDERVG